MAIQCILQAKEDVNDALLFPITPGAIRVEMGTNTRSIDTAAQGEVRIPINAKLQGAAWDGILPGEALKEFTFVHEWRAPADILAQIARWIKAKTPLQLLVTETPVILACYIDTFSPQLADGNGSYPYSIQLTELRTIDIVYVGTVASASTQDTSSTPDVGGSGTMTEDTNVRSGPGYTYEVIDRITKGTAVKVTDKSGAWRKIEYGKPANRGWVEGGLIKKTAATSAASKKRGRKGPTRQKLPTWYTTTGKEHDITDICQIFYGGGNSQLLLKANPSIRGLLQLNITPLPKGIRVYIPDPNSKTPLFTEPQDPNQGHKPGTYTVGGTGSASIPGGISGIGGQYGGGGGGGGGGGW